VSLRLDISWEVWGMFGLLFVSSLLLLGLCAYTIRKCRRENEKRAWEILRLICGGVIAGIIAAATVSLSDNINFDTTSLAATITSILVYLLTISFLMTFVVIGVGMLWYLYPKEKKEDSA